MNRLSIRRSLAATLAGVLLATSGLALAQSSDANVAPAAANKQAREIAQGDPARWYKEDATAGQRMRSRQKGNRGGAGRSQARVPPGPASRARRLPEGGAGNLQGRDGGPA
ncbi:hypothetical protein [Massilia sp. Se16.2.3]|uniref:hypothetical protein n=1 Tax=Massilia sp. Se16.2.3 TaxID=2709303 RepID=UPI0015FFD90E|nr:hypothetical protein [Massilia sp. Se16.2.3]QNA99460.1 hypothetical protein G4G31_12445 [Massilia sp. Se16.2.3]